MTTRDHDDHSISRRGAIGALGLGAAAIAAHASTTMNPIQPAAQASTPALKGRINHSVCKWCYSMPLADLCKNAAAMGLKSVELLNPDEWPIAKQHGLTCAVASFVKSNPIPRGFNRLENHDSIIAELEERLPVVVLNSEVKCLTAMA